ncbi:MAG TPA: DUF5683 domain-containing protein [Calditrichia bacterium]|nr:DUF5683 domain-containing protein [Calditrichia bacterium]
MRYLTLLFVLSLAVWADPPKEGLEDTGNTLVNRLQLHLQVADDLQGDPEGSLASAGSRKSVGKAVLFSAVLPGAGQFYNGSPWKALTFLAIEATAVAVNVSYNKKGKDKDTEFKIYADENWSEQRYWSYVYKRLSEEHPDLNLPEYQLTDPDGSGRELIVDWQSAEGLLSQYDNTAYLTGFTHTLPLTKTQQYYEMIGKYPEQFGNAWSDANFTSSYNGYEGRITDINRLYMDMRLESNQDYRRADYGARAILLNHFFSAVEAGFGARRINNASLSLHHDLKPFNGRLMDLYGLSISW